MCPQIQIGRDKVSASAIASSTNNATVGQAKTPHAALQATSCFWKQNVSVYNWKSNPPATDIFMSKVTESSEMRSKTGG
jgi:hypothetical protein